MVCGGIWVKDKGHGENVEEIRKGEHRQVLEAETKEPLRYKVNAYYSLQKKRYHRRRSNRNDKFTKGNRLEV